jgi:argininosuccinate synthase
MKARDLNGKTIAFAGSGGLDSCTITHWLASQGVKVVCCTIDFAQPDEEDINAIKDRMFACGVSDFVLIPGRELLAELGLKVIQSQATYEGRYWNTTGIARYAVISSMLPEMKKRGIKILSHGATGRGNDQVRFQLATNMLAPNYEVYAPWRDEEFLKKFGGRIQMIDYCEAHNLPIKASRDKPYSTDANMLGLTHEAGKLEELSTPARFITPGMGVHPKDAPDKPEKVKITFEKGRPLAINSTKVSLIDAILEANKIAGRNAVGIATHLVENRFVGIKSRGVYEAPGMELLGTAYQHLLELILDRRARELFDPISRYVSKQIYQGYWHDLSTQMAMKAVEKTAEFATGTIEVELYKGTISFVNATEVPHSLYSEENASMEAIGSYNHADAEGFLAVLGVSARVLAKSGLAN